MEVNDYTKYRGKCKEFCLIEIEKDPTLKLIRGFYYCPISNRNEQHWWCKRLDGTIFDPTRKQFLSGGEGEYIEFDGIVVCDQCGKKIPEAEAVFASRYGLCSESCLLKLVGLK
jgi:hypothetical protein